MTEPEIEISPLDKIRQTEADAAGALSAARAAAERRLSQARAEAEKVLQQAREEGKNLGQARCRQMVSQAEEDGRALRDRAHSRAHDLQELGQSRKSAAAKFAVRVITGEEDEPQ